MAASPDPPADLSATTPVAVVRSAYQAFARRDLRELGRLVSDDVRVGWANVPCPATTGREELLDRLAGLVNATAGTASAEPVALYATGALVIAIHREGGGDAGCEGGPLVAMVMALRGGIIEGIDRLEPVDP